MAARNAPRLSFAPAAVADHASISAAMNPFEPSVRSRSVRSGCGLAKESRSYSPNFGLAGERVRRIGLLMGTADDREGQARVTAFKQGLQELGWTERVC
jgi:hypothetical protein